jgi:hypothetical protein
MNNIILITFFAIYISIDIALSIRIARDADLRGRSGAIWGVLAFMAPMFVIPIYLMLNNSDRWK